jgi:hypothetical protein
MSGLTGGPTCQPAGEREKVEWTGGEEVGCKLCWAEQGRWEEKEGRGGKVGRGEKKKRREESGPRGPDGDGWALGFGLGLSFFSFFKPLLKPTFKHFFKSNLLHKF